jgi:hypothetical protein
MSARDRFDGRHAVQNRALLRGPFRPENRGDVRRLCGIETSRKGTFPSFALGVEMVLELRITEGYGGLGEISRCQSNGSDSSRVSPWGMKD